MIGQNTMPGKRRQNHGTAQRPFGRASGALDIPWPSRHNTNLNLSKGMMI